jgi:hypothetical protein
MSLGQDDVPEEVRALVAERQAARAARDFARADALREAIAARGYRVVDSPQGPVLQRLAPTAPARARVRAGDVPTALGEAPTRDASVHLVVAGWPEDAVRALTAFRAHHPGRELQYVVADLTDTDPAVYGQGVEVLPLEPGTGWAAAMNASLGRSRGRIVIVLDGSVEPSGEVLGPLETALADPSVGVCGPFGVVTRDLHAFEDSPGPEVDAILGYLMAVRREVLGRVGAFDERFRFYRTADIELSFRIRDAGLRALVVPVPVRRHEHRMWTHTDPAERGRLSKRNFYRFLERFRGRTDLLVTRPEA